MSIFFFFNDTATTEIYTLSLHDALPISGSEQRTGRAPYAKRKLAKTRTERPFDVRHRNPFRPESRRYTGNQSRRCGGSVPRSEEHTSELQSRLHLVCRLLLEKKKILVRS